MNMIKAGAIDLAYACFGNEEAETILLIAGTGDPFDEETCRTLALSQRLFVVTDMGSAHPRWGHWLQTPQHKGFPKARGLWWVSGQSPED